jgi:6-phosphogluconolactonase
VGNNSTVDGTAGGNSTIQFTAGDKSPEASTTVIWVGGYTPEMDGVGRGIAALRRTGSIVEYLGVLAETPSPSFLTRSGDVLYAAGEGGPSVSAFRITPVGLEMLGTQPSAGTFPCSISIIDSLLVEACYGDGIVGVHRLNRDGIPGPVVQALGDTGAGPHPAQDGPHAHDALRVDDSTVLTTDLGTDRVHIHSLGAEGLTRTGSLQMPAGTGPRDLVLHPSGVVWMLGELSGELFVLKRESDSFVVDGRVALPGAAPGDHSAAIATSSDGRYVYVGHRGSNTVSVVSVDATGSELSPVASVGCGGDWPRHLIVDGDFLHVANQRSSTVATFLLGTDGVPELLGSIAVPSPTYLLVDSAPA